MMYDRTILWATTSAIGLRESLGGPSPCEWLAGRTTALSGPGAALVNLSARQAKEKGLMTSGTFGPHGSGSSTSVDLTRYLASRLRVRLEGLGSTLFSLTWKQSATPAGRSFSLLRASAPRNKGTELTGWPAAAAADWKGPNRSDSGTTSTHSLPTKADLAGYPGPTAEEGRRGGLPARPWDKGVPLSQVVALAPWAAAAARDWRSDRSQLSSEDLYGSKGQPLARQALYADSGNDAIGSGTATASTGQLNPNLSRWIMGIPAEWASCAPTATRSSRRPPPSSSARTSMPWGAIF